MLPGFGLTLGFSAFYLCLIVLIPLSALFVSALRMDANQFWETITSPRVLASDRLTFGASFAAAIINAVFGLLVAGVLVRYRFAGRKLIDAMVDLPFALPTAVAGIALTTIYAPNGWMGRLLAPLGIKAAFTPLGIMIALTLLDIPLLERTGAAGVEYLVTEIEEARASWAQLPSRPFDGALSRIAAVALDGVCPGVCPGAGRIRFGRFYRGQYADENRDYITADYHQAGAIRLCRGDGDCAGDAGTVVYSAADD